MKYWLILLALIASPASAQINNPPNVTAAVQAALPSPCPVPSPDTLNGTAGTGASCIPIDNNTRPTSVQAINGTLDVNCNWSVTFLKSFVSSAPIVKPTVYLPGATQPLPCLTMVRSATAASGKCWPAQTTVLNLSIITAGLTLAPFGTTCTAGTAVMVIAREPTQ